MRLLTLLTRAHTQTLTHTVTALVPLLDLRYKATARSAFENLFLAQRGNARLCVQGSLVLVLWFI
jgi:hypothetical protein